MCFKGLKYCTLFLFLPMQFNPLEIALVQYVYTLYICMFGFVCVAIFISKHSDSLLTMGQFFFFFCDSLYCIFFLFSWGIATCA